MFSYYGNCLCWQGTETAQTYSFKNIISFRKTALNSMPDVIHCIMCAHGIREINFPT
jgi:hypothetical protein